MLSAAETSLGERSRARATLPRTASPLPVIPMLPVIPALTVIPAKAGISPLWRDKSMPVLSVHKPSSDHPWE